MQFAPKVMATRFSLERCAGRLQVHPCTHVVQVRDCAMAVNQARTKHLSQFFFMLAPLGLFAFTLVLHSGDAGNWALPTVLAFGAITSAAGLVLGVRAQRTQSPDFGTPSP